MHARGHRVFELTIVVAAVGIIAGLLLDRVPPLIARSEHTSFLHVRGQLQSALLLEAADRIAAGESASLGRLAGANPMKLLLKVPGNYAGSFAAPRDADIGRAQWYFNEAAGRLEYRAGRFADISTADGAVERLAFKVELVYEDRNGNRVFDAAADRFGGLRLTPVSEFEWTPPER